jgi:hypothetical protein
MLLTPGTRLAPDDITAQIGVGGTNIDVGRQFDVAPDSSLLINAAIDESTASPPITVILNWAPVAR